MMKKYLLMFITIFPLLSFAQNGTLDLNDGKISWQKIYETDLSQAEIKSILKSNPVLNPLFENFSGISNPVRIPCEEKLPDYMENQLQFFAIIEFKDDRYRVSISDINLISQKLYYDTVNNEIQNVPAIDLESVQLKNGAFKTFRSYSSYVRICLMNHFNDLFNFDKASMDLDW